MFATILLFLYVEIHRFVEIFSQVDRILIELLTLLILNMNITLMAIWFIKDVFKRVRTLQCHTPLPFHYTFFFS